MLVWFGWLSSPTYSKKIQQGIFLFVQYIGSNVSTDVTLKIISFENS